MNLFAFSSLLICITNLFIIFLVFLKGRNDRSNIIWLVFCIYISCWGLGGYKFSTTVNEKDALFWWQVANIGAICIPVTYYQFIYTFLDLKKNYQKSVLIVSYILGFIYLVFNFLLPEYFIGDLRFSFNQFFMTTFSYKNSLYISSSNIKSIEETSDSASKEMCSGISTVDASDSLSVQSSN